MVGEEDGLHHLAVKDPARCQAKGVLDLRTHRGTPIAHEVKQEVDRRGFDSSVPKLSLSEVPLSPPPLLLAQGLSGLLPFLSSLVLPLA